MNGTLIAVLATGLISGILGGMGMGGGVILVPALTLITGASQHEVQGINLLFFIPIGVFALIIHAKKGNLCFKSLWPAIPAGLIFSLLGAFLAFKLSSGILKKIYGAFICVLAVVEITKSIKGLSHRGKTGKSA